MQMADVVIIPVRLRANGISVAVTIRDDISPQASMVVFGHPEKLESVLGWAIAGYTVVTGHQEREAAAELSAACFDPNSSSCPNVPMSMAKVDFYAGAVGVVGPMIDSAGARRVVEMIRRGAIFIPLQVQTAHARRLQDAVGDGYSPVPAANYIFPPDSRRGLGAARRNGSQLVL